MRNTAKKATVRLSDIAKETGYSLSTVSKALNGRADVSEETRQTINAVLKRYGYSRKSDKHEKPTNYRNRVPRFR